MKTQVKYWRQRRFMSLRMLEERSGVNRNTIARIEKGEHTPHPLTLHTLAKALDVTVEQLVYGDEEKPASSVA